MIKLIYCLRRRQGLSRKEFQEYWLNHHGPLVKRLASATRMVRYVQNHTISSRWGSALADERSAAEPYDGVMEGWWESGQMPDAAQRASARRAAVRMINDERQFIDLGRSSIFLAEEHEIY